MKKKKVDLRVCIAYGHSYEIIKAWRFNENVYGVRFKCARCDYDHSQFFHDKASVKVIKDFMALRPCL